MDNNFKQNATNKFIDYLKIKSVQPTPDYKSIEEFLRKYAEDLNLPFETVECVAGKPICLMTLAGSEPNLPSLLLNSHSDVVPVERSFWKHPPFDAIKDEEGNIYARGTQDMKSVTIQHLEALRLIVNSGNKLRRNVHLMVVPDEEIGGHDGMAKFLQHPKWEELNVGVVLDEGLANPTEEYTVFYGERAPWWLNVISTGPVGHGSRFVKNSAMEKLIRSIQKFLDFRKEQEAILEKECKCGKTLGDVVTVNLTMLSGGVQHNVVPSEATAAFDIRIPPHVSLEDFKKQLDEWTNEDGVRYEFQTYTPVNPHTPLTADNVWWQRLKSTFSDLDLTIKTEIFPAATDSRYIRQLGIPAFGFSPMNQTPILLHDHNEYLNEDIFIKGIPIFEKIIIDMANLEK